MKGLSLTASGILMLDLHLLPPARPGLSSSSSRGQGRIGRNVVQVQFQRIRAGILDSSGHSVIQPPLETPFRLPMTGMLERLFQR